MVNILFMAIVLVMQKWLKHRVKAIAKSDDVVTDAFTPLNEKANKPE